MSMTFRRMDELVLMGDQIFQQVMQRIVTGMLGNRLDNMGGFDEENPMGAIMEPEVMHMEMEEDDGTLPGDF